MVAAAGRLSQKRGLTNVEHSEADIENIPFPEAVRRLERIATKIDDGQGTIGLLVNDPGLYSQVTDLSTRLNSLLARMEKGDFRATILNDLGHGHAH